MKSLMGMIMVLLAGTIMAGENFDSVKVGAMPPGWMAGVTGKGEANWAVVKDPTAPSQSNAFQQSGVADYCLCFQTNQMVKDGVLEVRFKAVSGIKDQAAGLVWRARDQNNYYICRANALEDNVVLYKTVDGKRISLPIVGRKDGYGVKTRVASNQWHLLKVEFSGTRFKVFMDGQFLFDVEDGTFPDAGMAGLWTKADSVTLFDDFAVERK